MRVRRLFGRCSHSGIPTGFSFRLFCSQEQNSRNIFRNMFLFRNIPNERVLSMRKDTDRRICIPLNTPVFLGAVLLSVRFVLIIFLVRECAAFVIPAEQAQRASSNIDRNQKESIEGSTNYRIHHFYQNAVHLTRMHCATFYQSALRHEVFEDVTRDVIPPSRRAFLRGFSSSYVLLWFTCTTTKKDRAC